VEVTLNGQEIAVKGKNGTLKRTLNAAVIVTKEENVLKFAPVEGAAGADAQAGTARALVNNMVIGVTTGFERKLVLVGVGYRAQAKGKSVGLALGFSHPIDHELPEGFTAECPTQSFIGTFQYDFSLSRAFSRWSSRAAPEGTPLRGSLNGTAVV
jgi:large subunit ribosomal protein L6